jgi:PKD repeat protein
LPAEANEPPYFLNPIGDKAVGVEREITFTIEAEDPDGDIIHFGGSAIPIGSEYNDNGDGTASFTWTPQEIGEYVMVFTIYDDYHDYTTMNWERITITVSTPPPAPFVKSLDYNSSYDFLEDLVVDDAEIVWEAVEGAAQYKVVPHYHNGYTGEYSYDNEFIIPADEIIGLGDGDLKFIWVDFEANAPRYCEVIGVAVRSIDEAGIESGLSNTVVFTMGGRCAIYGQICDSVSGLPIEGAKVQVEIKPEYAPPIFIDFYTDEDGMYFLLGYGYGRGNGGQYLSTRYDVTKRGYESSLNNSVTLYEPTEVRRVDIELVPFPPPVITYLNYNTSYDFLQDLRLDDIEIVWTPVENAIDYEIILNYGYGDTPRFYDGDEFIIPRDEIITLDNGDLKYIWVDYLTNHPIPVCAEMYGINMRSINASGIKSEMSDEAYFPPANIIYGQITDSTTGTAITDARIHVTRWVYSHYGYSQIDYGDYYTDADGMYFIPGISDNIDTASGGGGSYHLDVFKEGYIDNLDNRVELRNFSYREGHIVREDIALTPAPPVADFTAIPTEGEAYLVVEFTDTSTGIITSWSWDFGDDCSSAEQNPSHEYLTPGTYTISLTVTGPGGSDIEVKEDYIVVSVSTDVRLDTDVPGAAASQNAQVASDERGNVYAVWQDLRNGAYDDIYFNYSTDNGVTWQEDDIRVDMDEPGAAASINPQIACDGLHRRVYVVWQDARNGKYDIYARTATMNISTGLLHWNEEKRVDTDVAGENNSKKPQICSDDNGHVYVVWKDTRRGFAGAGYRIWANRSNNYGITWGTEDILIDNNTYMPFAYSPQDVRIRCDSNGNVYVAWYVYGYIHHKSTYYIQFRSSHDFGANWGEIKQPHFGAIFESHPTISCDENGNVYLACLVYQTIKFIYSHDYGETWSDGVNIGSAFYLYPDISQVAQIDCDNDGNVYIVSERHDRYTSESTVYFDYSRDFGVTWLDDNITLDTGIDENPDDIDNFYKNFHNPRLAADDNDNVFVVWKNDPDGANDIFFNYSEDAGVTWQYKNIRLDTDAAGGADSISPAITADDYGHVSVVWQDNRNGENDIYSNNYMVDTVGLSLYPAGDRVVREGRYLILRMLAQNTQGTYLELDWSADEIEDPELRDTIESQARFRSGHYREDSGLNMAAFYWKPRYNAAGVYDPVTFTATDPETGKSDRESITITVQDYTRRRNNTK